MIRNIVYFTGILLFFSCGNRKNNIPSGILSPVTMQGVFWDIIRTETYTNHLVTTDYKKNRIEDEARLQKQVFMIHGVSKEEFYKSYNYYKKYPLLMKTLLDSMINKAGREKNFNPGGTSGLVK